MSNYCAIDGSLLAFRAAAAGEERTIIAKHRSTSKEKKFKHRTEFKVFLKELNVGREEDKKFNATDFEIEDIIIPQPVDTSSYIVKEMITGIRNLSGCHDYGIFLDEGDTFRHERATIQKYKGNRDGMIKPANLQAVKDYLAVYYNTEIITEIEADDVLNMYQLMGYKLTKSGSSDIICAATFDKDAWGNPGWIFDFRKDADGKPHMTSPFFVDGFGELKELPNDVKGHGRKFFYFQILYGDDVDNYRCNKLAKVRFGKKSAFKILHPLTTDKECMEAIVKQYKEWYPAPVDYTSWDGKAFTKSWLGILEEYWMLARMLKSRDEVESPVMARYLLDKLNIEY